MDATAWAVLGFIVSCIAFCLALFFAGTLTHGNNQPPEEPLDRKVTP